MGPLDALWHLLNFFAPAVGLGVLSAAGAKLVWRRELTGVRWARLALWSGTASALVLVAGLVIFGRDGRMATYGGLVVGSAAALWWSGFGPGRR